MDNTILIIFGTLLMWHFLYYFHLQGEFVGMMKIKSNLILIIHCITWALGLIGVLSITDLATWGKFLFLFATHFAIDFWKCRTVPVENKLDETNLLIDQVLHILILLMVIPSWSF
jgi:hypothetical protein